MRFTRKLDKLPLPCKARRVSSSTHSHTVRQQALFALGSILPHSSTRRRQFGMPFGSLELTDVVGLTCPCTPAGLERRLDETCRRPDQAGRAEKLGRKAGRLTAGRTARRKRPHAGIAMPDLEDRLIRPCSTRPSPACAKDAWLMRICWMRERYLRPVSRHLRRTVALCQSLKTAATRLTALLRAGERRRRLALACP